MEEINQNLYEAFTKEIENYITKFSEQKKVKKDPKGEIIIEGKSHSDHIDKALQNLENIYNDQNKDKDTIKNVNDFITNKILLPQKLFFYKDKKKFMEFILNRSQNKTKLIENLLNKIENNKQIIFEEKDDYKFYEYLFLQFFHLDGNLDYTETETIKINDFNERMVNENNFENYYKLFLKQNNLEVIEEMVNILYQLYTPLDELIKKIKPLILYNKNVPCMKLLEYIIVQKENNNFVKAKSHKHLCKKNLVRITFIKENADKNKKNEDYFYFYENTRILEILKYFEKNKKDKEVNNYIYEIIYGKNLIEKKDYNKTLNELTKDKQPITITQKSIEKEKLLENEKLNEKFEKILKDLFKSYSKNKGYMDLKDIQKFLCVAEKVEIKNEFDMRIIKYVKRHNKDKTKMILNENGFLDIYISELKNQKIDLVWRNMNNLGFKYNLEKEEITPALNNENNMRYSLSNKIKENEEKIFINELKEKYKETNDIHLLNFLMFLSTNKESYMNLLETDLTKPENKFTSNQNNYIDIMYNLIMIESIIEDLELNYLKNDEKNKFKICSEEYLPFDSKENDEKKKNYFVSFMKNNYIDLIEYVSLLLKKLNENGINEMGIEPKICLKGIDIINNVYCSFYDINLKKTSDNYLRISSPNSLIKENKLEEIITNWENYKDIIEQIIIFINKYYLKNEHSVGKLINNCFYLLFYLIYTSNQIFEHINNNEKIKNNFNEVIKEVLLNNKNLIFQLTSFTNKIKKKITSCTFISYLIDIIFLILKNTNSNNFGDIISNNNLFLYIRSFYNYDQNDYNKFNSQVKEIYANIYNLIKSNDISNLEEPNYSNLINSIKILKKLCTTIGSKLKEEITKLKINEEQTLYELIIDTFFSQQKNKLESNKNNFLKLKESIDNYDEKFISYNDLLNLTNITGVPNINQEKENIVFKELYEYCVWAYFSLKENNNEKLNYIFNKCNEIKNIEKENISTFNSLVEKNETKLVRKKYKKYTGLKNISTTCYLNSVIQIMFMIPEFRFLILSLNDGKDKIKGELVDDNNLFHQLQILFTKLLLISDPYIVPNEFFISLKDPNNILFSNLNGQKDSQEFYLYLCDKIEDLIKEIPKERFLIKNFFGGKLVHISKCPSCNNISKNFEIFKSISVEVDKYKTLEESLDKYISSEKIKDYECSSCKKKVTINRESKISLLPNYLVIHLKRLVNNVETNKIVKINSRFEFPLKLNISKYFYKDEENNNKEINYDYVLKGINIHMGDAENGHFESIIREEKEKWYEFNDTIINEFDINNLEKNCFGGNDKNKTAYLLFYEKVEKQNIIKSLNENEIKDKENIEEKNIEKINDNFICDINNNNDKIYLDKNDNIYYQFQKWDYNGENKLIPKEYFLDIYTNSKVYFKLLSNNDMYNFDNNFIKLLISLTKDKSFKMNEYKSEMIENFIRILLNVILSYYFRDNNDNNEEKEKNIIYIIENIIKPNLLKNKNEEKELVNKLTGLINTILFTKENLSVIFSKNSVFNEEATKQMYELVNSITKINTPESNKKLFKNLNHIVNDAKEEKEISFYIYQILFEFFKNKILDKINIEDAKNLFMPLFYKFQGEKNENNMRNISEILRYLIKEKSLFNQEEIQEIKLVINIKLIFSLFDVNVDFLTILIQKLQYNDNNFSEMFNTNYIMKLYTHCEKKQEKEKNIKFKLIKFILSIFEIIDKYTFNRIYTLLGYPSLVFKSQTNFGVSLMEDNVNTEIYEYMSYNHIKKERCVLAQLFPSKYNENNEFSLTESERLDLIYELLSVCFGLNGRKKGNYFLFKFLYLTQSRNIFFDNLYQEIISILENNKNKKYDLTEVKSKEKKCIEIVNYEKENLEYIITISSGALSTIDLKQKKYKTRPELPEIFEECKEFLNEKINIDFYGTVVNIVPFEIQKILVSLIASNDNLSIFRFEYFTNYFTRKELLTFNEEQKKFSFEFIKRDPNDESKRNKGNYMEMDYNDFINSKDINQFLKTLDAKLSQDKGLSILNYDIDDSTCRKTIIRYFVLSKKKNNVLKLYYKAFEIPKDVENNFYLPELVFDCVEKEKDKNVINIHRIKHNFKFLDNEQLGISLSNINYEKYFNEFLN